MLSWNCDFRYFIVLTSHCLLVELLFIIVMQCMSIHVLFVFTIFNYFISTIISAADIVAVVIFFTIVNIVVVVNVFIIVSVVFILTFVGISNVTIANFVLIVTIFIIFGGNIPDFWRFVDSLFPWLDNNRVIWLSVILQSYRYDPWRSIFLFFCQSPTFGKTLIAHWTLSPLFFWWCGLRAYQGSAPEFLWLYKSRCRCYVLTVRIGPSIGLRKKTRSLCKMHLCFGLCHDPSSRDGNSPSRCGAVPLVKTLNS